ncbi:MAG: glycosyltransferase, partial [Duncaniella sp.]|nr:glycosyltransferase [Duncaniella sp.]
LIEAAECGLPIVSYACPTGPKDIITDGLNGFLIPPGDEDLFADRICQLIENEELRISMGKEARIMAQEFTIDKIINRWKEIFEKLVSSR